MSKLTIELVPSTSWGVNVRSMVTRKEWDILRKQAYAKADLQCEICGGVGKRHPVECHEVWDYDDNNNKQVLTSLISLCPSCHMVKHAGRTISIGKEYMLINQLKKVNKYNNAEALKDINAAFRVYNERSTKEWDVDISYLYTSLLVLNGDT
jgi:hypothetical protein